MWQVCFRYTKSPYESLLLSENKCANISTSFFWGTDWRTDERNKNCRKDQNREIKWISVSDILSGWTA